MNARHALHFALNLLLVITLAAGPALAMPSMPGQAAAMTDAVDPPCHGPALPMDDACAGGCCADASCDPSACRMAPVLMVSVAPMPLPARPAHASFALPAAAHSAAPLGAALRPPIA